MLVHEAARPRRTNSRRLTQRPTPYYQTAAALMSPLLGERARVRADFLILVLDWENFRAYGIVPLIHSSSNPMIQSSWNPASPDRQPSTNHEQPTTNSSNPLIHSYFTPIP